MRPLHRCPLGVLMAAQRDALAFTVRDLARITDHSPAHVSEVETGRRSPSPAFLRRLMGALSVDDYDHDRWWAAAGMVEPGLMDALMAQPERWREVRAVLRNDDHQGGGRV